MNIPIPTIEDIQALHNKLPNIRQLSKIYKIAKDLEQSELKTNLQFTLDAIEAWKEYHSAYARWVEHKYNIP